MKRLHYSSGIISFLNRAADIMALNVAFLVACLPIFTYGPARTALYACTIKWTQHEDAGLTTFIKEFKRNFRCSLLPGLLMLVLTAILYADLTVVFMGEAKKWTMITTIIVALLFFPYREQMFLFAARFECGFMALLRNTLIMNITNFFGGILSALLMAIPMLILIFTPASFIQLTLVWLFGYYALAAWVCAILSRKTHNLVIAEHAPQSENQTDT